MVYLESRSHSSHKSDQQSVLKDLAEIAAGIKSLIEQEKSHLLPLIEKNFTDLAGKLERLGSTKTDISDLPFVIGLCFNTSRPTKPDQKVCQLFYSLTVSAAEKFADLLIDHHFPQAQAHSKFIYDGGSNLVFKVDRYTLLIYKHTAPGVPQPFEAGAQVAKIAATAGVRLAKTHLIVRMPWHIAILDYVPGKALDQLNAIEKPSLGRLLFNAGKHLRELAEIDGVTLLPQMTATNPEDIKRAENIIRQIKQGGKIQNDEAQLAIECIKAATSGQAKLVHTDISLGNLVWLSESPDYQVQAIDLDSFMLAETPQMFRSILNPYTRIGKDSKVAQLANLLAGFEPDQSSRQALSRAACGRQIILSTIKLDIENSSGNSSLIGRNIADLKELIEIAAALQLN